MIDAVGLVTPSVTKLKIQQVDANEYVSIFKPDYIILHCDETTPIQFITEKNYRRAETFNPLDYTAGSLYSSDLPRSSCYQIWKNINN
jgi:hypothetical protein